VLSRDPLIQLLDLLKIAPILHTHVRQTGMDMVEIKHINSSANANRKHIFSATWYHCCQGAFSKLLEIQSGNPLCNVHINYITYQYMLTKYLWTRWNWETLEKNIHFRKISKLNDINNERAKKHCYYRSEIIDLSIRHNSLCGQCTTHFTRQQYFDVIIIGVGGTVLKNTLFSKIRSSANHIFADRDRNPTNPP